MKRTVLLLGWALLSILLAFSSAASGQQAPEPPNLIFVLYDDARYSDVIHQDGTQELAAEGTLFTDFHLTDPQCCPSRSTFLTGMYAHNTGILKNGCDRDGSGCWQTFKKRGYTDLWLPKRLQDAGYKTGVFGKLMNGCEGSCDPPNFDAHHFTSKEHPQRSDHAAAEHAAEFFRANAAQGPVAVFLWVRCPHVPCQPGQHQGDFSGLARDDLDASYAEADVSEKLGAFGRLKRPGPDGMQGAWQDHIEMAANGDDGLQLMRQTAREMGEYENTVWAVTSDNGWNLGEHRAKGGKTLPYTADTHVPLVMAGPGIPHGESADLAANHDFVPTIAALLGLPPVEGYTPDGRNLFGPAGDERRVMALVEHAGPYVNDSDGKIRLPAYKAMLKDDGDLYIDWANGHVEYYDEPTHTIPSDPAPTLDEWLASLVACEAEACRTAENGPPAP